MNTCKQCKIQFEITEQDKTFYQKIDVPEPTLCPACSHQRKLAFRNERTLYLDTCNMCKKKIVSMYNPDSGFAVYCPECMKKDTWEATEYAQDFDYNRPFFEQFKELGKKIPRVARMILNNTNSDYVNYVGFSKNCYLCFAGNYSEDCMYCNLAQGSKNCVDCDYTYHSELCYQTVGVRNCYNCRYIFDSTDCIDSEFLKDCRNCTNCFMSCNLTKKNNYFKNKEYSPEEYKQKIAEFKKQLIEEQLKQFNDYIKQFPKRCNYNYKSEDCVGEYITKSKNCFDCYQMDECEDCSHVFTGFARLKSSSHACYSGEDSENLYETIATGSNSYNLKFCIVCLDNSRDLEYCESCTSSTDCFGCINLNHKQYCILNKQYTKEEYIILRSKIIEHMKETGEWGQFFSPDVSPFGYNETVAMDFWSLTKEEAQKKGFNWQDDTGGTFGKETKQWDELPQDINQIDDSICNEVLACKKTGKNFKIIKQELEFYKKMNLPLPKLHPEERHKVRFQYRNSYRFHHKQCDCSLVGHRHHPDNQQCPNQFETTYSPDRPEKIFCEQCYQKEII